MTSPELAKIDALIFQYESDLQALRRARAMLTGDNLTMTGEFSASSITQAALVILGEAEGPMHFREICEVALERGYRARRGTTAASTRDSFRTALKRIPDQVEFVGLGKYRLKPQAKRKG